VSIYRQSDDLGAEPLEVHDKRSFFQLKLCLRNILSDKNMVLSLVNVLGLSTRVHFAHIASYWKLFPLHYMQVFCQYREDNVYLKYLMLQRLLTHLNTSSNFLCTFLTPWHAPERKPFIFKEAPLLIPYVTMDTFCCVCWGKEFIKRLRSKGLTRRSIL
jgi:hypothetical protein